MKCPFCGQEHPDNTKFCPKNGNRIEITSLTCLNPDCGLTGIPLDANFCPDCGRQLQSNVGGFVNVGDRGELPDVKTFTVNGVSFDMIKVKAGTFTMGDDENSDSPEHEVELTHDYYIGKFLVTNELGIAVWEESNKFNKEDIPDEVLDNPDFPLTEVDWRVAKKWIRALRKLTNEKFDLPTEAEWEYAARGGHKSEGYRYSGSDDLDDVAWYSENSDEELHDVGELEPNELGIYDMSGLVEEWCNDWYDSDYYDESPRINPRGPKSGNHKVVRGGSINLEDECDICWRGDYDPSNSDEDLGFRLVLRIK